MRTRCLFCYVPQDSKVWIALGFREFFFVWIILDVGPLSTKLSFSFKFFSHIILYYCFSAKDLKFFIHRAPGFVYMLGNKLENNLGMIQSIRVYAT